MEDVKNQGANGGNSGNGTEGANIEMQREIDKAVTKALATQKAKLDKEYGDRQAELQAKLDAFESKGLTDAEKAAKQIEAAAKAEAKFNEQLKRLEVKQQFVAMGVEEADYSPVIDDFFKGDFTGATSKLSAIVEKKANQLAEEKFKASAANIPDPKTGSDGGGMTKEKFQKLTYSQQMAELEKHPEYAKFI